MVMPGKPPNAKSADRPACKRRRFELWTAGSPPEAAEGDHTTRKDHARRNRETSCPMDRIDEVVPVRGSEAGLSRRFSELASISTRNNSVTGMAC